MTNRTFLRDWSAEFGSVVPDGSELRQLFPRRWTRFHALPGAKRSAENPQERAELLRRADCLARDLFGDSEEVWVAYCQWAGHGRSRSAPRVTLAGMRLEYQKQWPLDQEFFEIPSVPVYAVASRWQTGAFDRLLLRIAEDTANAVFFAANTGRVLAPYDGGFDVIDRDGHNIRRLEQEFGSWMSQRADRL